MEFIAHRINSKEELKKVPNNFGIELDVRPWGNDLIMEHDPFVQAENLEELLAEYHHGTLIFNIKSERVEFRVLELVQKYNIKDYFFLDSSLPIINQLAHRGGNSNMAIRFSELEPFDSLIPHQGRVKWVWVDCFNDFILTKEIENKIHAMGFKICIVSPELQGRPEDVLKHKKIIQDQNITIDAVCSKIYNKDIWLK